MKKQLRFVALALVAFMALGCATGPKAPAPLATEVGIVIAHTNDMHSRAVAGKVELGYDRIANYVNRLKLANANVLVIDAGDTLHGLPFANLERGSSIVKLMNAVPYDYMTTGNHDFNYGTSRLLELQKQMKFPIIAANVYKDGKRLFKPYEIRNVQGVRVLVAGVASPETAYKTDPKGLEGVTFTNPVTELRTLANELAGSYDVFILISHIGLDRSSDPTSDQIGMSVPEIDVIIDGHSHTTLETAAKENRSNVLIASTGSYDSGLGVVELKVGVNRKVVSKAARTVTVANTPELAPDAQVKAIIDELNAGMKPILAEKVGATAVELVGKREIVRTSESNLGRLIANSMLFVTGADVSFIGGGGVRETIPAGDITKNNIFTVLPFGNYIQTAKIKGSEFDAIIEHGVGKLPAADGRFPHFAGLTYTLDATQPAGSRVSAIMIGGKPVDEAKEYVFAATNFNYNGGDDFKMLVGKKILNEFPSDAEVFMAYVKKLGTVTADNIEFKK
ncbi:MAG: bifunctional metallophosphatase/5'-nucleotidase [Spirochaetaceae bacterium]|nr:bifunctional metallophosphatase/5'-nucleotidase [Spirochaetaceae bacterium]